MTRRQAIKAKCMECCNGQRSAVEDCQCGVERPCGNGTPLPACALWPFRLGKNPFRPARVVSDAQRAAGAAALIAYRQTALKTPVPR